MVWIIDRDTNKVTQVALGSKQMLEAANIFMWKEEAEAAHRLLCKHPTKLGNSKTRQVFCADCNLPLGTA